MRLPRKRAGVIKWLAVSATVLLLATATINTVYEFGWRFSPRVVTSVHGGCFMVTWSNPPTRIGTYWTPPDNAEWGPGGRWSSQGWFTQMTLVPGSSNFAYGAHRIRLPLWCLLLPCAAIALVAHRAERRARAAGSCPRCSYDLRGLTAAVCPECGKASPPAGKPEAAP